MANEFLTVEEIARDSLLRLQNNLVMAALVHTDHSQEFASKGDTVQVKAPATFDAKDWDTGDSVSTQDIKEDRVLVKLDQVADVTVEITSRQLTQNIQDFGEQVTEGAMQAIAQKIDYELCKLYKGVHHYSGDAGQTPDELADIAQARKVLNDNKAPFNQRRLVVDTEADAELLVLDAIVHAEKSGTTDALREANIGRLMGFDTYMDQNIFSHGRGTLDIQSTPTNITVSGAHSEGATEVDLAGVEDGTRVEKGDIVEINEKNYAVTEQSPVASSNTVTIKITPGLKESLSGGEVVERPIEDHTANLAFHRNAFAFVNRPMALPMGGAQGAVVNYNGLSIRATMGYGMSKKVNTISWDILYGNKVLQADLACRMFGSA